MPGVTLQKLGECCDVESAVRLPRYLQGYLKFALCHPINLFLQVGHLNVQEHLGDG